MTRMLFSLALLAAIGGASGARADTGCSAVRDVVQPALCADPDLAAADAHLGQTLAAAQQAASPAAQKTLDEEQEAWRQGARTLCSDDPAQALANKGGCVLDEVRRRIDQVEHSVAIVGPFRFVLHHGFTLARDPDPDSSRHYGELLTTWPQIEDPVTPETTRWNEWIAAQLADATKDPEDGTFDLELTIRPEAATEATVSVSSDASWYGHGAAHGVYSGRMRHYLLAAGRELDESDLFPPDSLWTQEIAKDIYDELVKRLDREPFSDAGQIAAALAETPRWRFGPDGMTFLFDQYELASYADGPQEFLIRWERLRPFLVTPLAPAVQALVGPGALSAGSDAAP